MTRIPEHFNGLVGAAAPAQLEAEIVVSRPRAKAQRAAEALTAPALWPVDRGPASRAGGGLPLEVLGHELRLASRRLDEVARAPLPDNAQQLVALYSSLGRAIAVAEACLLSALDALDARTGGGVGQPAAGYARIRSRAFAQLRAAGEQFARIEPAFARIVHGGEAWPCQPLAAAPDRGDGRPLFHYRNTYKKRPGLSTGERQAEHQKRVDEFVQGGGRFSDIITATPGCFEALEPRLRYDYVMSAGGTLRLFPNGPSSAVSGAKPGHSLLATGGPCFADEPMLLAGELWVYKDSAGDVEAVVVANNSGHFKPEFADLPNALPLLEQLGLPRDKVVFFGGPNNLPSLFTEIAQRCGLADLSRLLPEAPERIVASLASAERQAGIASVRTWQEPVVAPPVPPPANVRFAALLAAGRPAAPKAPGADSWVGAQFRAAEARAAELMGPDRAARMRAVQLELPDGDTVTSKQLVEAMEQLDVSRLKQRGLWPVATWDFDKTLMADDVFGEFAELALARGAFCEEGNAGVIELLAELGLEGVSRARLEKNSVVENVELARDLMEARAAGAPAEASISFSEYFFIVVRAMKGMRLDDAKALARELYETGAPGKPPYKTHVFDPTPAPGDSAADLVATLKRRGLDCYIVTAGLTFLARAGARYVHIPEENVIGAEMHMAGGRFTGSVVDVYEVGKPALIMEGIGAPPLFAFGDTALTDGPMLKLALVQGFMVDPRPAFLDMVRDEALDFVTLTYRDSAQIG